MAKTKEGRQRTSPLDLSSEAGRMLLRDLMKPNESKFSPFLESDYQSQRFWKSRPEYQTVSYPSFLQHAAILAKMARKQMTSENIEEELARIGRQTVEKKPDDNPAIATPNKENKPNDDHIHDPLSSSKHRLTENTQVKSLRDTIVASHPNREMAIIIFEFDGDIDENSIQLQFAQEGSKIKLYSRIPMELTSAASLLGNAASRNSFQDADCMLLDQVIKDRLRGSRKDSDGHYWEIREVIDLPFPCKKAIYNKNRDEISTYLLRKNAHGYAWGYFWVLSEHVGPRIEPPTKIRCRATSDDENENDGNASKSILSEDECGKRDKINDDPDPMELDYEAPEHESAIQKKNEVQMNEDTQHQPVFEVEEVIPGPDTENFMKNKITQLQKDLDSKNNELIQLKHETDQILIFLKQQHEQEMKTQYDEYNKERDDQIGKMNKLVSELEDYKGRQQTGEKIIGEYEHRIHELESQMDRFSHERCDALEKKEKIIQELYESGQQNENNLKASRIRISLLESEIDEMKNKMMEISNKVEEKEKQVKELEQKGEKIGEEYQNLLLGSKKKYATLEKKSTMERKKYMTMLEKSNAKFCMLENEAQGEINELRTKFHSSQTKLQEVQLSLLEKDQQCVYQNEQIEKLQSLSVDLENKALQFKKSEKSYIDQINGLKNHLMHQGKYVQALERKIQRLERRKKNKRLTSELTTDEEIKNEFGDLNRWDVDDDCASVISSNARENQDARNGDDDECDRKKNERKMGCNFDQANKHNSENDFVTLEKDHNQESPEEQGVLDTEKMHGQRCNPDQEVLVETVITDEGQTEETNWKKCGSDKELLVETVITDETEEVNGQKCGSSKGLLGSTGGSDDASSFETILTDEVDAINERALKDEKVCGTMADIEKLQAGVEDNSKNLSTHISKPTSLDAAVHGHDVVEQVTKVSKKRKAAVYCQEGNPNKRLRKSRRIEEKRLARLMKPKID